MTAKFLRSDGIEFECNKDSASFALMSKDGSFTRLFTDEEAKAHLGSEAPSAPPKETDNELKQKPLSKMNKTELLAEAAERGLTYENPDDVTKAQIIAAIEEADAAEPEKDPNEETK